MLKVLDLFSGIGGFSLGLERTGGFETVAFCEIEPFPRRVLAKHWPEVPCYEDVRTLTADRLRADGICVDVISAGFPCQDLSKARGSHGIGDGLEGSRSGLWSEIIRLAGDVQPRILVVENVTDLLSRGFGRVLGDLASLGYDAEWHCIPASATGARHERDRVWLLAEPNGQRLEGEHGEGESQGHIGRGCDASTWLHSWNIAPAHWLPEPRVCRVADGFPARMDRLRAIGNAVVPAIPELIGNAILASLKQEAVHA